MDIYILSTMIYSYNSLIEFQNSLRVDMWQDSDYVRDLLGGHYRHKIHSFNLRIILLSYP